MFKQLFFEVPLPSFYDNQVSLCYFDPKCFGDSITAQLSKNNSYKVSKYLSECLPSFVE